MSEQNMEESAIGEEKMEERDEEQQQLKAQNIESDKKKPRKFKPKKFISKLSLKKINKEGQNLKSEKEPLKSTTTKDEADKMSNSSFQSFRQSLVKRFSRRKNYKVSPMLTEGGDDKTASEEEDEDEPLLDTDVKEVSKISKSYPILNDSSAVHKKINEDSLELSKSMHTVDKSDYVTLETSSTSLTAKQENKKVQLKITISGKKVEKINAAATSASEMTTMRTIVNENEVDKASPLHVQQNTKSRTDIMLPSTSTTVRVSTSSSDEIFSSVANSHANMHVLQQAKSINKPSVPYSTVVRDGHVTSSSSVSEREIEKYLVLTSNLNSIISAAKDLDKLHGDEKSLAIKPFEFPKNLPELKIYEESGDSEFSTEKETSPVKSEDEMKKSKIPVNKRRSSSHGSVSSVDKEPSPTRTVHTQEAHQPYNLNLSSSVSTEDLVETESPPSSPPILAELKPEDIKFELGTSVRPPKILQPSPIGPIADIVITEAELSVNEESRDDTFHSPKSESSITIVKRDSKARRKIAYIPELSIYTAEEQELLKSNITANHSESFDIPSLPPDSSIFPVFDESSVSSSMTPTSPEKRECLYKILVIGELGTGKTSFIKRYVHQFFSQNYRATIGVDFALKVLSWDESTIIRLQLWDIAGQERFGNMTRVYYKEAVGAFIVFDVTRTPTFDAVKKWKQDLDGKVQLPDGSPIPCILLANKCDQQKQGLVTMPLKMDDYCRQNGFTGWFETSAKDNTNIEESAKALVSRILLNDKLIHNDMLDGDSGIVLGAEDLDKPKKFCSC